MADNSGDSRIKALEAELAALKEQLAEMKGESSNPSVIESVKDMAGGAVDSIKNTAGNAKDFVKGLTMTPEEKEKEADVVSANRFKGVDEFNKYLDRFDPNSMDMTSAKGFIKQHPKLVKKLLQLGEQAERDPDKAITKDLLSTYSKKYGVSETSILKFLAQFTTIDLISRDATQDIILKLSETGMGDFSEDLD